MTERDILLAAIKIVDTGERAQYIERTCAENSDLRAKVESLFGSFQQVTSVLGPATTADDERQKTPLATAWFSAFLEPSPTSPTRSDGQPVLLDGKSNVSDNQRSIDSTGKSDLRNHLQPSARLGWLGWLGHFEIERIIGRGAFGIVVKAFDEKLHRVVAIKVMNPELAMTSPPRKRFLREARTAAAMRHENIVGIYAVEEEPLPYLVMEYISGPTLQQKLDEKGPLELPDVLRIAQQLADALASAHAIGLIHRDIKPANILLEDGIHNRAKFTDFGLARAVDDASLTQSGMIAGTPLYMAPEQARGETLDGRADLFSLGTVLYQMVGGRPPFRAANTFAVLKRVCEDTPRPLQDVIPGMPDWICLIINRMLEKNPDDRFQSAEELAALLACCQNELQFNGKITRVADAMALSGQKPIRRNSPCQWWHRMQNTKQNLSSLCPYGGW